MNNEKYPHVGRPTNEEVKQRKDKQKLKIIAICLLVLALGIGIYGGVNLIKDKLSNSKPSQNETMDDDGFNIIASAEYASGETTGKLSSSGGTVTKNNIYKINSSTKVAVFNANEYKYLDITSANNLTTLTLVSNISNDIFGNTKTKKLNKLTSLIIVGGNLDDLGSYDAIAPNLKKLTFRNGVYKEGAIRFDSFPKLEELYFDNYILGINTNLNLYANNRLKKLNVTFDTAVKGWRGDKDKKTDIEDLDSFPRFGNVQFPALEPTGHAGGSTISRLAHLKYANGEYDTADGRIRYVYENYLTYGSTGEYTINYIHEFQLAPRFLSASLYTSSGKKYSSFSNNSINVPKNSNVKLRVVYINDDNIPFSLSTKSKKAILNSWNITGYEDLGCYGNICMLDINIKTKTGTDYITLTEGMYNTQDFSICDNCAIRSGGYPSVSTKIKVIAK